MDTFNVSALVFQILRLQIDIPLTSMAFLQRYCLERSYTERLYKNNSACIHTLSTADNPLILIEIESNNLSHREQSNDSLRPDIDLHMSIICKGCQTCNRSNFQLQHFFIFKRIQIFNFCRSF